MARKRKDGTIKLGVKGFFRLQIVDKKTGKVVGDSGDVENQITNYGLNNCLIGAPIKATGSVQIAGALLGSGAANPAATDVVLADSLTAYYSTVGTTINGSTQAQFTQSFDGTLGAVTINNIGLFAASTGSLIAGKTFASSAVATSQSVNITYNLNYTTS